MCKTSAWTHLHPSLCAAMVRIREVRCRPVQDHALVLHVAAADTSRPDMGVRPADLLFDVARCRQERSHSVAARRQPAMTDISLRRERRKRTTCSSLRRLYLSAPYQAWKPSRRQDPLKLLSWPSSAKLVCT